MSNYAKIETGAVVEVRNMADNFDPAEVAHKFDFRIVIVQTDPVFDPLTHRLVGGSNIANWDFVINPSDVEATRKVIALTQEEIDQATQDATDQAERDQAKALYQDLKSGAGNNNDRLLRVEMVLARLLRDAYGP